MKKKLIAFITSFALLFTTAFYGLSAPVHAEESGSSAEMPEAVSNEPVFFRDPETGHISMEEPAIYSRRFSVETSSEGISPNKSVPPYFPNDTSISYVYNKYPATRSQYPYGTCWAHAATACAEFDLVTNHGASKTIDLSELQLAWFHYHTGSQLPGLDGDVAAISPNAYHYLEVGGNMFYSMHTMAQWKTFTTENRLPYQWAVNNKSYSVPSSYNTYHDGAQLRNVRFLNIKFNPESVKQAIINHGAVYISYRSDSRYYNSATNTYNYTATSPGTNHDIVIVGWDDYKNAWLARNSWEVTSTGTGSNETYFWLNYDDKSLANTAYSLDFEPYSPLDNMYQYDGATTHSFLGVDGVANVFTASSSTPNGSERLDSVMIPFTGATNVSYKVEIYTDLKSSKPTDGQLQSAATTTGTTTSKGIYTIDLKKAIYLSPGEKFSIVVTAPGLKYFDFERSQNITYQENGYTRSWFDTTASIDQGESFYYFSGKWTDLIEYGSGYGNACIKAITSDSSIKQYDVKYNLNGGTNSSSNPTQYFSTSSGTFTLKAPNRSGYHFLGWYSDSSFTNKVTTINYESKKDITLYAKWCSNSNASSITVLKKATTSANGSYESYCTKCGLYKGKYTTYKISSIGLDHTKLSYTGSNRSPKPVIKTSSGSTLVNGTDYTYTYNKSTRKNTGRYYVTIKFKERYSADSVKKYFTIVPKAPASASAVLYGHDDIKVSWSKCTGASGYAVYYKKSTSSKYVLLKRTTSRYVKKANLTDNVKYNFKIVPYYKSGSSRYGSLTSKAVSATTLKQLKQPSMVRTSNGRVSLTWQSISGASGYQVYWSANKKGTYKKLCDYSSKYTGVTFSVGKGKTYYYKTRAYKKVGNTKIYGPFSTPKAFKR